MNTAKIATLYPYFLDALQQLHTGRSLEDMLHIVQQAQRIKSIANAPCMWVKLRDNENRALRYCELGLPTDEVLAELVPTRVFEWVCRQQPAAPIYDNPLAEYEAHCASEHTGWQVTAHQVMAMPTGLPGQPVPAREPRRLLTWMGSAQEVAQVLRGLYALRTKRRKQTRRLVAQLRAYHLRQALQRATQVAPLALAAA
jgi:hypothetical protein